MPLVDLLPIFGAMSAPAFFLSFACAALGAPLLALVCLTAAALRSSAHPEAYARRALRMALSCAVPALLALVLAAVLAMQRAPWLWDWLRAAPTGPGLFAVACLAFCASLITMRRARPSSRRGRQDSRLGQTFVIALLGVIILVLGLALAIPALEQARAVLAAPAEGGIAVATLILPDISALPANFWTGLAACCALCMAAAGAMSLEYLLLLRDREPFGRDALANILRLGARATLRSTLLAAAFLPVLWNHLPELPRLPGANLAARVLLAIAVASCLLLSMASGIVAHSNRPWDRSLSIHVAVLSVWLGLTACLSIVLVCFYAA